MIYLWNLEFFLPSLLIQIHYKQAIITQWLNDSGLCDSKVEKPKQQIATYLLKLHGYMTREKIDSRYKYVSKYEKWK